MSTASPGEVELEEDELDGGGKPLKHDPSFRGPTKKRSCTDIICCLIFFIFILGLAVIGYFAFTFGDPKLLIYPVNSEKELCGYGDQKGKPYLFFFDLVACGKMGPGIFVDGCPTPQICVSECPKENFVFIKGVTTKDKLKYCKPGVDLTTTTKSAADLVLDEDCPSYYLESRDFIHRCVPAVLYDLLDSASTLATNVAKMNTSATNKDNVTYSDKDIIDGLDAFGLFLKAKEYGEKVVQDVVASWWMILIAYLLAAIVSLIWIVLMRWLAGVMVWITILAFVGLFGFSSFWCIKSYLDTKDTEEAFHIHMAVLTFSFQQAKFWLGFGIISIIILAVVILILLFLCQRIRIAIALIKEGSRAVGNMMFTLIFPIIPFALQLGVIGYWIVTSVYLASTGRQPTFSVNTTFPNGSWDIQKIKEETASLFDEIPCDTDSNVTDTLSEACGVLKHAQEGQYTIYLQIYNLFMLFWLVNFCIALGQMTLAGAFASYYWAFEKPRDIPSLPLLRSFARCFRYHLGSLALGSVIIAIVQLIRTFLEYLDHKLKGSENPVAKFFLKCLKCCFWCLEQFLRFLNKNAYIMIAVHGKGFCRSAKKAFNLILRNVVRVIVVDKVTGFVLLIGKLVIVGAVATASFFFFDGRITFLNTYKPTLHFYVIPVVLVTIGAYIIATTFFNVYSMAVDTLFLCFLEDLERNDGSTEKPYFMPKKLMKILGKKNKPDKDKGMEMSG